MLGALARDWPHLIGAALIAGLVAGLLSAERKGALQLMLSRPLVLAPLLGLVFGDVDGGLMLAVPLELLTLGGVSLGASVPDNETTLAAGVSALVIPAGLWSGTGVDEALAGLGLLLLAPLGLVGQRLDRRAEAYNTTLAERATERAAAGDPDGVSLNLVGLLRPFAIGAAVCTGCALLAPAVAAVRHACPERAVWGLTMGWHFVWALSAATAIRAIRLRRAPLLSSIAALAVFAAVALARVLG